MRLFRNARWLLAPVVLSVAAPGGYAADDIYRPPELPDCACLHYWGELDWSGSYYEGTPRATYDARLGIVSAAPTDTGTAVVGLTLADLSGYSWTLGETTQSVVFDEAYVMFGGDTWLVSAGRQHTIANLFDDTALTLQPLGSSVTEQSGIGYRLSQEVGGNSVQLFGRQGGFSGGVAIEAIGSPQFLPFAWDSTERSGSAVGVMNFVSDSVVAHVTAIATDVLQGEVGGIATHSALYADYGSVRAMAALSTDYLGWLTDEEVMSVAVDMSDVTLAATVTGQNAEWSSTALSVEWQATRQFALGAYVEHLSYTTRSAAQATVVVDDRLALGVELGIVTAASIADDVYARARASWTPTQNTELTLQDSWSRDGHRLEASAKQRF